MKIRFINFTLAAFILAAAPSYSDSAKALHSISSGEQKIKQTLSPKTRSDNLYFIHLKDSALSSYTGALPGLSATKSDSQTNTNLTAKGQLNTNSNASQAYKSYLVKKQSQVVQNLGKKLKRSLDVKHSYQILINAVATPLDASEVQLLESDPEVLSIEAVGLHQLHTATGPEFIGAKKVWQGDKANVGTQGEGIIVGIIDTGINAYHPSFSDIDSEGYDHTNPLGEDNYLGDCQVTPKFCNDKLIGIVSYPEITENRPDVIDENYDELSDKLKVGYDFLGHGSHVASTAAGNVVKNVNYYLSLVDDIGTINSESAFSFDAISGVAPHANIVSYQVCDDAGCYPELTLLALEHAIENGINVINYSVGGTAASPWSSAEMLAFLNAREAGIHIATSAGNNGSDAQTIGSPGNAPWITTVAAYTHDQSFSNKSLEQFTGGDTTLTNIAGSGATTGITGDVVFAKDYGDAQCLTEFETDTFRGEIVVCERGDIARVRKGINVQSGGAGGLILINLSGEADSLDNDNHVIPAIHIDAQSGEKLIEWLSSGDEHKVTITAATLSKDSNAGDIAGIFSSRGPNLPFSNVFAPDLAAPGVDIYAANSQERPFGNEGENAPYITLSGTSMSSPHVAGALALINSLHPKWTPSQVQSAIMSTAHKLTYKDDDLDGVKERSTFFDQGAGSLRVNDAVKAGLLLNVTKADYLNADPDNDGDPSNLNTSSMVQNNCISSCSWTRIVTATQASEWQAEYELLQPGFNLSVSPESFTLNAGESITLTITATANIELEDEWVHGYVILNNTDASMSDTHLQATIGFKAGQVVEQVDSTISNTNKQVVIEDIVTSGSNDLQVTGFGLFKAEDNTGTALPASNEDEQSSPEKYPEVSYTISTIVKPYTKRLIAEIVSSTSPDMDLYVGIDDNNDGVPDFSEIYYSLVCLSGNTDSEESCIIENPQSGNYWIFAHNFQGSTESEPDSVTIRLTQITYTAEPSFEINAPTLVAQDEVFDVTLDINSYLSDNGSIVELEEGTYYGLLELSTTASVKRNIGTTLLKVTAEAGVSIPVNNSPTVLKESSQHELTLSAENEAELELNLFEYFSDPDGDTLTFSVEGVNNAPINDGILTLSFTEQGNYEVLISASDEEYSVGANITVNVLEPISEEAPPPTKKGSSGGGSLGYISLLYFLLVYSRKRRF